ncbi:hypothetical protein WJX79_007435 [Trebouxia sp. C0005]
MAQPAAVHPGNALQLVQLSQLIDNIAESAYKGLQGLSQTLPALSDEERKHALLLHLHSTRQRLLRLHVLVEWSNKAAATKEVLETGSFQALPSAISEVCGPPKRTAQQRQTALRHMDFLLRMQLLQEVLPVGMHVHCVGSGHAKLTFKGYYTAVLTLAEAPGAQAEPPCQPGPPQQGEPVQGQPLQQPGHPQQQQPGHLQQQQPGANEPKDVDQQADEVTSGCMRTVSQDDKVGPHEEKYRWRLLSFDILPDFERTVLTPEQQKGLQAELESQMWQAADIRAQHSLAAAQLAQQAQQGTDTAQSGPAQTASEPVTDSSRQPVSARAESSHPSSQGGESGRTTLEKDNSDGTSGDPAPHPLQLLHNVLAGIAGRLVLHEVHTRLRKLLDEKGRWAKLLKLNAAAVLSNGIRCSFWLNTQTASSPATDLKALNVQQLLLQAAGQHAVVQLEALHYALQQQTSLTTSGCTTHLISDPNSAADLAGLVPLPSGPAQAGPVPARALSPSLVMSSRGTALLVVSVQLKTGFLRLAAGCGAEQNQRLKQQENRLASLQKDMRFAPLEDPSLSRGEALSRALAQELSSLFLTVAQQACFAQLAAAAEQHGLMRSGLPQRMLSGYLERDPSAPRLDPASCLALAFPPTPLLQAPTHAGACTPGINLGLQTNPAPTQSLAASQRQTFPLGPTQAASQLADPRQTKPIYSGSAASPQQAVPSGARQSAQTAGQPAGPPVQTLFSSRLKGSKRKPTGQLDRSTAALRFYLLAELKQASSGAEWHCYLLACRCTFRGVVQQVMSCATVPSNLISKSQEASAVWTADLGRVVAWCFSTLVEKHLLAELKVLGIPYTEELALRPSITPGNAAQQVPFSNKRQKLSQHDAIQNALGLNNTAEAQQSGETKTAVSQAQSPSTCQIQAAPVAPTLRCCITCEPELPHAVLESFQNMAELEEEGLLLDALAITAQPLAIVANAISPEQCRAFGLQSSQLTVVCKKPPYQLQLRVQQVQRPTLVLSLRQEGFAASAPYALADRGSQAVLASSPESPGRTKSTSLLSQQLNRESSLSLAPADVKRSLETCHDLPSALPASIKTSTSLEDLQAQHEVFQDLTVQRAFTLASKAHAGQQRRNGEPVFVHCVETARTLAELGLTADVVAAGLLHDILDDTLMTEPQLRSHFSHSLVDMESMDIFSPLANRLGVWSLKAELEDLCFQQLHPVQHSQLQKRLKESQHRGSIELALNKLSQHLDCIDLSYKELSGRPKNLWGVHNKMKQKQQELDGIYDLRAIRVIVRDKTDCYAVLRQVHNLWQPVAGRFKDYIQNPKANGYRSLHTVVVGDDGIPVEVQIRTAKMHFIAEHGLAAHWRYKEKFSGDGDEGNYLAECHAGWARYVLTWQMHLTDSKVRPSGSPGRDSSLVDLMTCPFPEHSSNCKFVAYMNQIKPTPVSKEVAARYPINIFLTYTKAGVRQHTLESFPPGCTPAVLGTMMQTGMHDLGDVSPFGVRLLVNEAEIDDANKPLSFGDFVEVVPCESPQLASKHPVHLHAGNYLFPRPQHGKHRPPIEQQRQQLNSIYSLPSDDQHSPTNMWRVSSTELTTPPQRHGAEARRPVPSA